MRLNYHRVRIRYKRFAPRSRYGGLLEGIGVGLADLLGGAGIFGGAGAAAADVAGPTLADLGIAAAPAAIDTGVAFGPTLADLGIGTAAADVGAAAVGPTLADLGLGTAAADTIPTVTAPQLAGVLGATGQDVLPTAATSTLAGSDAAATAAGAAPLGTTLPGAGSIGAASAAAPAGAVAPGVAASVADPTAIASGDLAGGFSGPMASAAPAASTASTAASGGGAAAAGGSSGFNLSNLVSGAKDAATIGAPLVAGAGLLYNIEQAKKNQAAGSDTSAITNLAEQQAATGTQLQGYLTSGTLPAGIQTGLNQAASAQKAALIQKYANMGMPTDPSQNSALAQDISNLNQQVQSEVANIGAQLFSLGQQGINLSNSDLQYLANLSVQQSQATGNAISNFAAALAGILKTSGGNKGTTITVG